MNELQSLRSNCSGNVVFGQLNKDILSEFSEAKLLVRICVHLCLLQIKMV